MFFEKVYILPNPSKVRSCDFILVDKGNFYRAYDLKTIMGKNSVSNRLAESVGQTNRVILNMAVEYYPNKLANEIKKYFETYSEAKEVIVFKGKKMIRIYRDMTENKGFIKDFSKKYRQ